MQPQYFTPRRQQEHATSQVTPPPMMIATPSPLHCCNTNLSPAVCQCATCAHYRNYALMASFGACSPSASVPLMPESPYAASCGMMTPQHLIGCVVDFSCTSVGRVAIQSMLVTQSPTMVRIMYPEVIAELDRLALDSHGCHVLRAFLDHLNDEELLGLMHAMNPTLVLNMCTLSQYTRRVLQALFERNRIDLQPVVEVLAANAQYLAATQQGCISLIKIYHSCSHPQKAMIMSPLLPTLFQLSTDPYGNYVVQCAVEFSDKVTAARYVHDHLGGHLLEMSCNKFASNVMEKIVSCLNVPVTRRLVLDELIYNPAALQQLVGDAYGNFVVQSIIDHCSALNEFKRISDRLRPLLASGTSLCTRIDSRLRTKRLMLQPPQTAVASTQPKTVAVA